MRVRVTQGDPRENEKRRAGQADPGAHKLKRQTQGETHRDPQRPTVKETRGENRDAFG